MWKVEEETGVLTPALLAEACLRVLEQYRLRKSSPSTCSQREEHL